MMRTIIIGLIGISLVASAQRVERSNVLTGDLQADLIANYDRISQDVRETEADHAERLSPLRAALYSAVVPGSGQIYTKGYWEAAAFAAVEVGVWILYASNHSNALDKTDEYRAYADERWSVVDYVNWMRAYYAGQVSELNSVITNPTAAHPWEQVDWGLLNYCESEIAKLASPGNPNGFTHVLPIRPGQQYYELIGKYGQFGGGWDDASSFKPGGFTVADVVNQNVSPHFLYYRDMRGDANTFHNNATTAAYVLVANHVFSAIEAAWSAARFNKALQLHGSFQPIQRGNRFVELVPTMRATVSF